MRKLILFLILLLPLQSFAFGWITDTHIGDQPRRKTDVDIIYPKKTMGWLNSYLKRHKNQSVLITGDVTHRGKGIPKIKRLAKKYNVNLLLTRGNHDLIGMPETYYSTIVDGCKLIVLDSNFIQPTGSGGLSPAMMVFLKKELDTDLPVVVAMHHSVFHPITNELLPEYSEFVGVVSGVSLVLSGHIHRDTSRGIFTTQSSFSSKKSSREITCP